MVFRFKPLKSIVILAIIAGLLAGTYKYLSLGSGNFLNNAPNNSTVIGKELQTNILRTAAAGQRIFRYDTFGDEVFWGDTLKLHKAIAGENLGGIGPGVSPKTALSLGLKVDVDALPKNLVNSLKAGEANLDDPATTLALLKYNAVVGLTGFFDKNDRLISLGIQCALCHSTVDNSLAPGIGRRLDGWAARDLNIGAIIAISPNLQVLAERLNTDVATVKRALLSWGPGKYDAVLLEDGKAFRPDGLPAATLLPPAFGLSGINLHTWTGWGSVTHWNAYVANTQMRAQGIFFDPRLNNPFKYPIAVKTGDWNIRHEPDLVTSKLPALQAYQLALVAPTPPEGSYDKRAAARGKILFNGRAKCSICHVPPLFSEPGWAMHTPAEMGVDSFQADRSPDERYRTAPLRGLWTHQKGGFYHDGRFATLNEVINHYDNLLGLNLTMQEKKDLIQYLKSI